MNGWGTGVLFCLLFFAVVIFGDESWPENSALRRQRLGFPLERGDRCRFDVPLQATMPKAKDIFWWSNFYLIAFWGMIITTVVELVLHFTLQPLLGKTLPMTNFCCGLHLLFTFAPLLGMIHPINHQPANSSEVAFD